MNSLKITNCIKERERVVMVELSKISPNRRQPRKSFDDAALFALADSIHRHGILQPLTVRKPEKGETEYELVAGERRLRAASLLKLPYVPCIIIEADEKTSAAMAIIENIQRSDLNIFEEAHAIYTLKEIYSMTQEQIATILSVSQSYIANKLRILRLSAEEQKIILENGLTERHCRALIRISETKKRSEVLLHIVKHKLNVSGAEAYIDKLLTESPKEKFQPRPKKLKDIRIFYNSIDRAVESVRNLGIAVESQINESDKCTEIKLLIPKIT